MPCALLGGACVIGGRGASIHINPKWALSLSILLFLALAGTLFDEGLAVLHAGLSVRPRESVSLLVYRIDGNDKYPQRHHALLLITRTRHVVDTAFVNDVALLQLPCPSTSPRAQSSKLRYTTQSRPFSRYSQATCAS